MSTTACCPSCGTTFRVAPEQLRASDGWVRCGRCSRVFDTTDTAMLPAGPAAAIPDAPTAPAGLHDDEEDDAPWTGPAPAEALRNLPSLDLGVGTAPPTVAATFASSPVAAPPPPPLPFPVPPVPQAPAAEMATEALITPPVAVLRQADIHLPSDGPAHRAQVDAAAVARSARERLGATTVTPPPAAVPRRARRIAFVIGLAVLVFAALLALRWRDTLCSWVGCGA
ncbi:zinc-ribbon domain-containing protein [Variovorax ginsengisoli]|uniref:Zn finger-like uncharacterized protein n=1 Tax=Variovorax ginsengisoli TaxID=363844 RepID=A0ABT9S8K6_9BURK|nr:zinc-ribbon domain-containing protein [Variovorax ginsengisoli]MDP9900681.1 putative Zn finger-like uncharacterized protein [Variovorax ginsengisoli]